MKSAINLVTFYIIIIIIKIINYTKNAHITLMFCLVIVIEI
jgi:hypothetical protein